MSINAQLYISNTHSILREGDVH